MNDATERLTKIQTGKRKALRNSCESQPARIGDTPRIITATTIRSQVGSASLKTVNISAKVAPVITASPRVPRKRPLKSVALMALQGVGIP